MYVFISTHMDVYGDVWGHVLRTRALCVSMCVCGGVTCMWTHAQKREGKGRELDADVLFSSHPLVCVCGFVFGVVCLLPSAVCKSHTNTNIENRHNTTQI